MKTILLMSLALLLITGVGLQTAKSARWDNNVEKWVYQEGSRNLAICMWDITRYTLTALPFINSTTKQEIKKGLEDCDNDELIMKLDVCPSHDNKFPVCSESNLNKYVHDRGLDNIVVAPLEWSFDIHPENQTSTGAASSTTTYPGLIISKASERFGLSDEEYISAQSTNPKVRAANEQLSAAVETTIKNCENTLSFEKPAAICIHDMLYWKGRCMTDLDVFSFCGPSGSLQKYLIQKNLADSPPVRTFINFIDGTFKVDENLTNENIKEMK